MMKVVDQKLQEQKAELKQVLQRLQQFTLRISHVESGRILAAPTDQAALQGRLSIEMAVRALENWLEIPHAGPAIQVATRANIDQIEAEGSLAPASFVPVFSQPAP